MLITCSNCQSKIRVPDSAAGKKGKCPKCGTIITIPAEAPPEEAAAEAVVEEPAGSPFDFSEEPAPSRKGKAKPAGDEEVEEPGEAEDEERPRKKKKPQESTGLSLTALILGIVSLVLGCLSFAPFCCFASPLSFLCGVGSLITGFLGMNKGGKTMAIIGMCLGGFSILLTIGAVILAFSLGFANVLLGSLPK
jgi:predicted Zn finger-like uncharacterized protein